MNLSASYRLWAGGVALTAIALLSGAATSWAEIAPGVSTDPMTGAARGPAVTDGTRSVWQQGDTDRGGAELIIYSNTNPVESRVLSAGHWYLDPMLEDGHVVWAQSSDPCPIAHSGDLCTPHDATWDLIGYSLISATQYKIGEHVTISVLPTLHNGVVTWTGPDTASGGPISVHHFSFTTTTTPVTSMPSTTVPPASVGATSTVEVLRPAVADGVDTDGDGVPDLSEVTLFHTNPLAADSDGDGLDDYHELYLYHTDATKFDTDGDGLSDGREVNNSTNPFMPGTDFLSNTWYEWTATPRPSLVPPASFPPVSLPPAVFDGADSDGDGIPDQSEITLFHTNPYSMDTDGDGLSDYRELYLYHTDATKYDTDGDGLSDGLEVQNDVNPFVPGMSFLSHTWYEWTATPR